MESGIEKAIEQMGQKNEAGLNYIYSKTYNFVYLRAKSIFRNEEEVRRFMQKVYLQAYESVDGLKGENLYEWLGKRTYFLGSKSCKKRKEREMSFLEMEKQELNPGGIENSELGIEIICDVLEELPEMYQVTVFAFYYDYLKVEEIAELMECSRGVIRNRLNYVRKYIKKAMENYVEEHGGEEQIKITFSIGLLCDALRRWSVEHCLGITAAQGVYSSICKEVGLKAGSVHLEGIEFAGVNNTVVYHKQDDIDTLGEEIVRHAKKQGIDRKILINISGIAVILIVAIAAAVMLFERPEKNESAKKNLPVTTEEETVDEPEEPSVDDPEPEEPSVDVPEENTEVEQQEEESEYIFEKSNTEALTREEVQACTKEELRLARNEIYARHGVIFGVEDLDTYFRSKSWYQPKMPLSEFWDTVDMSMVEEENINLITEVEGSM